MRPLEQRSVIFHRIEKNIFGNRLRFFETRGKSSTYSISVFNIFENDVLASMPFGIRNITESNDRLAIVLKNIGYLKITNFKILVLKILITFAKTLYVSESSFSK